MKKVTAKRSLNPSGASLREMPEVDFSAYRIRKNPYASRIAREGAEIVHHGPIVEISPQKCLKRISSEARSAIINMQRRR